MAAAAAHAPAFTMAKPGLDQPELRKQVGAVSAISASKLDVVGLAAPTAALVISAFSAISASARAVSRSPSRNTFPPLQGAKNEFPPVSAGFRRFRKSSAGPVLPKHSRFPPFPPFPPRIPRWVRGFPQFPLVDWLILAARRPGTCAPLWGRKWVFALSAGHLAAMRRRRPAARIVPATAADRAAPDEASLVMNIMPILSQRRSAGISHNIAQERQEENVGGEPQ